MSISLNLTDDQSERLAQLAKSLSVDPRELAQAAVSSLLMRPADDFDRAASDVLKKNKKLYERLS